MHLLADIPWRSPEEPCVQHRPDVWFVRHHGLVLCGGGVIVHGPPQL